LALPQVTLCCVDSTARLPWALDAMQACLDQIDFGDAFLCTDAALLGGRALPEGVRWVRIDPLHSIEAYSEFVLRSLTPHVSTSHVLLVQWDGFVLNAAAWSPGFLDFDYIGAPWPHLPEPHRVGNGGFSLRSARLLNAVQALPLVPGESEDISIGITHRPALEAQGLSFAPTEVAARFSVEDGELSEQVFGFHAPYHLPKVLSPERTLALVQSMTPSVVNGHYFGSLLRELTRGARERPALMPALRAFERLVQQAVEGLAGEPSRTPKALGLLKALIRYGQFTAARRLLALRREAGGQGSLKLSLRLNVNWLLSFFARR
jgi:hypothetical protein